MRLGLYVICAFAAVWGVTALSGLRAPAWVLAAPVLISIAVVWWVAPKVFAPSDRTPESGRRASRAVIVWSGLQAVGIVGAAVILPNLGLARLFIPVMALCVALHFIGLAKDIPFRPYYVTGAVMTLTSLVALSLPGGWGAVVAASAGALILWATSLSFPFLPAARRPSA
ncbi:hypothetical protein BH09PSE2_BH09PSE2_01030 [soil metagenome]